MPVCVAGAVLCCVCVPVLRACRCWVSAVQGVTVRHAALSVCYVAGFALCGAASVRLVRCAVSVLGVCCGAVCVL